MECLLQGDEFEPDYGTPLQIAVCSDQAECTSARYGRVWNEIETRAPLLDVMLLSEADDSFKASQILFSSWIFDSPKW